MSFDDRDDEFAESGRSYTVYDRDDAYICCCYLYPLGRRTELSQTLADYDVDVRWWVTSAAYERGEYTKLYAGLRHWLAAQLSFWRPYYSNQEIPPVIDQPRQTPSTRP